MVCSEYQERIKELGLADFGAGDATGDAQLQQHLAACVGCREELARRSELLARIDSGVAAMVAVEPSPSLAVLIRRQIAEESAASRTFGQRWGWWIGAGAAAAAIAAIALAFIPRATLHPDVQLPGEVASQHSSAAASASTAPAIAASAAGGEIPGAIPSPLRANRLPRATPRHSQSFGAAQARESETVAPSLEVLIPANQRVALVQLAVAAAHNQLDERILVREAATAPLPAIEVKPLKIDLLGSSESQDDDGSKDFN